MKILNVTQGSPEWLAVRATHFTASEAPAMMGASKYLSRADLLRQKHTGLADEVDENKQRLFDRGHAAEAAARPIVQAIIGDELYQTTGIIEVEGLPLLASFDGLNMLGDTGWENKLFNAALAEQVSAGELNPHYYWQLEQQLLVSGAERIYFTTSDGTPENTVGMWYEAVPGRREKLIAGWKQFAEDLANYQHVEPAAPKPVANAIEALPALVIQAEGRVLSTNLDAFKAKATAFIDSIKTRLVTDQDFADADQMVKFLKDGEGKLALAKEQALAQTASLDELFRTVDAISEQMRSKRLALEKLVKAEKEDRKADLVVAAKTEFDAYLQKLNARIGGNWMPPLNGPRWAEAVKGLKSLDSMRDKLATALAHAKIEANEIADRIEANRKLLAGAEHDHIYLFPDFALVCTKAIEDFAALLFQRQQQEERRKEAEREAIRQQEAAKQNAARLEEAADVKEQPMGAPQAPAASTPPLPKSAVAALSSALHEPAVDAVIDDFLRLLPIGVTEKKALRVNIQKWEKYRIARIATAAKAA